MCFSVFSSPNCTLINTVLDSGEFKRNEAINTEVPSQVFVDTHYLLRQLKFTANCQPNLLVYHVFCKNVDSLFGRSLIAQ